MQVMCTGLHVASINASPLEKPDRKLNYNFSEDRFSHFPDTTAFFPLGFKFKPYCTVKDPPQNAFFAKDAASKSHPSLKWHGSEAAERSDLKPHDKILALRFLQVLKNTAVRTRATSKYYTAFCSQGLHEARASVHLMLLLKRMPSHRAALSLAHLLVEEDHAAQGGLRQARVQAACQDLKVPLPQGLQGQLGEAVEEGARQAPSCPTLPVRVLAAEQTGAAPCHLEATV